jgi:cholinesterase
MENFEIALTEHGPVRGIHKTTCLGVDYISFQGIPYMKAPLGRLRFRDPQIPKHWIEPFNASEEASSYCALNQITKAQEGQENAGIVNVYTKSLKPQKLFSVIIHVSF